MLQVVASLTLEHMMGRLVNFDNGNYRESAFGTERRHLAETSQAENKTKSIPLSKHSQVLRTTHFVSLPHTYSTMEGNLPYTIE